MEYILSDTSTQEFYRPWNYTMIADGPGSGVADRFLERVLRAGGGAGTGAGATGGGTIGARGGGGAGSATG